MGPVRLPSPRVVLAHPRRAVAGALVVVAAVVIVSATSCSPAPSGISLGTVGRADVTELVDASATVSARAAATLTAAADGTLAVLAVTPGSAVAAGQVLAVIDSPSAQQRLDAASQALAALDSGGGGYTSTTDLSGAQRRSDDAAAAAFAAARETANKIADPTLRAALLAQVTAAERAYGEAATTSRALVASVQAGLADLGQAVAALTAAQRAQAQGAHDLAKSTVDALTLRAPFAGVVQLGGVGGGGSPASLNNLLNAAGAGGAAAAAGPASGAAPSGPGIDTAIPVGAPVSAGTPVLTVVDTSELGLLADVDETDVLLVSPGIRASVELDAAPGARYDAAVRSVDVLPTTSARGGVAYRVRLSLAAGVYGDGRGAPTPRPGMSAVAHLAVRSAHDAVAVPVAAVFSVDGHDVVWAVRSGLAVQAPVTVGVAGPDLVQVVSGLATGDRIVVRGADQVHPGQRLP